MAGGSGAPRAGAGASNVSSDTLVMKHSTTIGDYSKPNTAIASSNVLENESAIVVVHSTDTGDQAPPVGTIELIKTTAGGLTNKIITKIRLDVVTALGNIRVKAYKGGATPTDLIGESGSIALVTGLQEIALTKNLKLAGQDNVWLAFEVDNAGALFNLQVAQTNIGEEFSHTFGTGPDPAPASVDNANYWNIAYRHADSSFPAESSVDDNTTTRWKSNAEINPNIYADMNTSQNLCAIAIHPHANTTETEIKIQSSSDAAVWTDKRKITVSKLTNGAWNFIRMNIVNARYLRIFGNSGVSKVLAENEIKVLTKTDAEINLNHGHLAISNSDTALDLDGT